MEPPAKRPRLGISPYNNNRDEVDGDELNLQPEQVNALRDPGYQLERSRAVAANRLKSAFERIFEKYEKDFTGIGDEINLETGEVEVDNGHIQSLEDAILGDEDEEEEEEDGDDSDSMDEEERLLQGKASIEKRPSCIGQSGSSPLKSLIQPLGNSQPWPADPPRISSMFGPPRPPLGSFSTEYQITSETDTLVDPTWKAPQLPVVETYVDPAWKAPELPRPKPATPRLPALKKKLLTARSGDQDDDDILNGASTTPMTKLKGPVSVKRAKKLSPSHTQGSDTVGPGTVSKSTSQQKENKTPKSKALTQMKKSTAKKPDTTSLVKPSAKSGSKPKERTQTKEKPRIHTDPVSNKQLVAVKSKKSSHVLPTKRKEPGRHSEPEIYTDISSGKMIATKPQYQKLSVEIVIREKIDTSLYQVVPTEPSDDQAKVAPTESQKEDVTQRPADGNAPTKEKGKRGRPRKSTGQKVYKRNVVDSSFVFSDDEDPALPKPKISKQPPARPRGLEQSPLQIDTENVPRSEVVSAEAEDGVGSALNENSRESKVRTEKTHVVADQHSSGEAETPEPVAQEVYSRNDIDPTFTFSDEDDSALPKTRVKASAPQRKKTPQKSASMDKPGPLDEPVPTSVDVLSTTPAEPNAEGLTVPQASANEQPAQDEIHELSAQETVTEDPVVARNSNDPSKANIEHDAPLAPVESSKSSPAPEHNLESDQLPAAEPDASPQVESEAQIGSSETNLEHNEPPVETDTVQSSGLAPRIGSSEPNLEKNEPPAETDTVQQPELTPQISSSEPTVAEPSEIVEETPVRLLQMKPRRKRKISMALTEESMPSPTGPEGDKPTETFITAPSKRLKRSRLSYSVNASELGGQQEDQTVQLDPKPVTINDITIPETSPPPPPASVEFTIPESSPPLIQPAFNSSLMGIVEDVVQLDDAPEPASDMDFDDTPSHPTPMPDLPSPDLGEDARVPETSPLPYSSPSKAVKAVKKPKPKVKPPLAQPSTPVNRKKKKQTQQKAKEKLSISPAPSSGSKGLLSLIPDGEDDENELETDELSLTPRPRYYTPPSVRQSISQKDASYTDKNKHTSLTAPLLRMKLLSSSKKAGIGIRNNPKTPSQGQSRRRKTLMAPIVNNNNEKAKPMPSSSSSTSRIYFSADRRSSTLASSSGGVGGTGGVKRRRQSSSGAVVGARQHTTSATPRVPRFVQQQDEEEDMLLTSPGGTKRRCGEDGFHCDRDFCFVCL